jgi:antitoxin HicB
MLAYAIETTPDDNATMLITCPRLPEVTTFAADVATIDAVAANAIEEALAARIASGGDTPLPLPAWKEGDRLVRLPTLTGLKVSLYVALKGEGVTRAELARRLGWHREQVDRLFRLDHASRLDQIEAALGALGRQIDFNVLEAA